MCGCLNTSNGAVSGPERQRRLITGGSNGQFEDLLLRRSSTWLVSISGVGGARRGSRPARARLAAVARRPPKPPAACRTRAACARAIAIPPRPCAPHLSLHGVGNRLSPRPLAAGAQRRRQWTGNSLCHIPHTATRLLCFTFLYRLSN